MPQTFDAKYEQDVIDLAKGMLESYEQGIRTSMGKTPTGAATPNDEELAGFFFKQQKLYPPALFTYPDGHQVFASPWILALEFCENGKEWVDKFHRFKAKAGPPMQPITRTTGAGIESRTPDPFNQLGGAA